MELKQLNFLNIKLNQIVYWWTSPVWSIYDTYLHVSVF